MPIVIYLMRMRKQKYRFPTGSPRTLAYDIGRSGEAGQSGKGTGRSTTKTINCGLEEMAVADLLLFLLVRQVITTSNHGYKIGKEFIPGYT